MLGPLGDAIEMKLEAAFPAALMISVVDQSMASLGADLGKIESLEDGRFTVFIMDTTFVDKTAEERQVMVREVLKDEMPRIAELNLKTRAPGELRQKTEKLAFNLFFLFFKNRETRLQCFFFLFQKQRNSPTIVFFLFGNTKSHIQLFCSVTHHLLGGGVNPPWLCAQLLPEQGIVEASSPDEPRGPPPPPPLPSTPPPPQPTVLPHPYPPQGFREQGSSLRRRPRARDPTRRGFFFLSFLWTLPTSSSPLQPHPHPPSSPPPHPIPHPYRIPHPSTPGEASISRETPIGAKISAAVHRLGGQLMCEGISHVIAVYLLHEQLAGGSHGPTGEASHRRGIP